MLFRSQRGRSSASTNRQSGSEHHNLRVSIDEQWCRGQSNGLSSTGNDEMVVEDEAAEWLWEEPLVAERFSVRVDPSETVGCRRMISQVSGETGVGAEHDVVTTVEVRLAHDVEHLGRDGQIVLEIRRYRRAQTHQPVDCGRHP